MSHEKNEASGYPEAQSWKSQEAMLGARTEVSRWRAVKNCLYRHLVKVLGEDWIFLLLLGALMALVSWAMDFIGSRGLRFYKYLFALVEGNIGLQYLVWVCYPLALILFSSLFCQIVSPQAVGSGIPELKTIIRGAVLHEYLTLRTFVAKTVGLTVALSAGFPLGKEGPFVHIASICATLLNQLLCFISGRREEPYYLRADILTVGCALGISCCFGTPLAGVLFSIEVTCSHFGVRSYWRGFLGGAFSAFIFRVLSVWVKDTVTLTALFKTNFRGDIPFDLQEMPAFAIIGIASGFFGALFVYLNRQIIVFMRKKNFVTKILKKQRLIYPAVVTFVLATLRFPPGVGQFFGAGLMPRETINSLFDNYTWTKTIDPRGLGNSAQWFIPHLNIFIVMALYFVMHFWMAALAVTMPVPCGAFVPVFNLGAVLGRFVGELMALLFPDGLVSNGNLYHILPGEYAVIGAAAMTGAVTHAVSTAVICFELTGQISHVLPMMVAVILANMVAQGLQPSLYDSIIQIKKLPYLPELSWSSANKYNIQVGDIMVRDVTSIASTSTYGDLLHVLRQTKLKFFPFVDTPDTNTLLGSIDRTEVEGLLQRRISAYRRQPAAAAEADEEGRNGETGASFTGEAESSFAYIDQEDAEGQQREGLEAVKVQTEDPRPPSPVPAEEPTQTSGIYQKKQKGTGQVASRFEEMLTLEEIYRWEQREKNVVVNFETCRIDQSPFQLVEGTSLQKTHTLFSLLGLDRAYVTSMGKLVGVVALAEIQAAIEGSYQKGFRLPPPLASFRDVKHARNSGRTATSNSSGK
uniref:Chloride channel protein n=2 Tax=Torpedo marmorata TaxID=7788 RepID=CICH_TORMA|nr:RecName: Full=Chloride channel protein; AltName: Full=ClC-0 [Torpedo marmorata]CAA40078.1 chloride channel protein [Torpedo marmorata]